MQYHVRNQAIAEAYEAGEPVTALALRFGEKSATIKRIVEDMKPYTMGALFEAFSEAAISSSRNA